jgi:hypothetical protein
MIEFGTQIDNEPVSIQLSGENQTTVPSGEVWRVSLSMGKRNTDSSWLSYIRINGRNAVSFAGADFADYQSHGSTSFSTVLVGGDTIRLETEAIGNNDLGCHISGFKNGQ